MTEPLIFKGAPGSPYTRKMLAILRYRHIPYSFLIAGSPALRDLPVPRVELLPTFYLPDAAGVVQAVTDSTPLLRRFEVSFLLREPIPRAIAFRASTIRGLHLFKLIYDDVPTAKVPSAAGCEFRM